VLTAERQRALERVRRIVLDALKGRPARVYLFGSSATGSARSSSDIDVAIEPMESLPPSLLSSLRELLEESTIPYDVDVVDISTASPTFRERVRQEGILWTD
jgi:predicted nucleotidyltransferase